MEIPATTDIMQYEKKIIDIPEIRVWCHPHRIGGKGDDYFLTFDGFKEAFEFINKNKVLAEDVPLIAFRGFELNIFEMKK